MTESSLQKPDTFAILMMAIRPRTLPAAAASAIVGSALAFTDGKFQPGPALAALLVGVLLQIGANFANDVFDFHKGADTQDRLGPVRVTQAGLVTPAQMLVWTGIVFGLAGLAGLYLTLAGGWPVVIIGVCSILAALAYTGGPFPFGYHGLGDLFVFIFFGLVAVCGTYYVQALEVPMQCIWAAVPMGLLITAILVVNNLRDIETDRKAGKKTLAVRLGAAGAQREYVLCLVGAYLTPIGFWLAGGATPWVLLSWLSLPYAIPIVKTIFRVKGRPLNKALAATGQLTLFFALLFSAGLILGAIL